MHNFVHPNQHGTVFALKQWLHQREATCMESSKCIALVGAENPLTSAGPKSSPLHRGRYGIENGKMQNFVHPNHHGTVFAIKQWLHHREATCMESSKMYCPRRCRKPTYPSEAKSSPLLGGRYGIDNEKNAQFRAPQSPWYRVCTKAMVTSEGSYVY